MEIFGYFISSLHLYGWKWWNKVVENFHKIFALFALYFKTFFGIIKKQKLYK